MTVMTSFIHSSL